MLEVGKLYKIVNNSTCGFSEGAVVSCTHTSNSTGCGCFKNVLTPSTTIMCHLKEDVEEIVHDGDFL